MRTRFALPLSLTLLALGCAGKQTGDEGDASEFQPMEVVENTPISEPAPPDRESEPEPPPPTGGPSDSCSSQTWSSPDEPKREATCTQHWDESGEEPVLKYVCSCDLEACPLFGELVEDGDPSTPPEQPFNGCVVEGVDTGCRDSLEAACGVPEGQHGFCERAYYGLTPTRPDQTPLKSATLVCFEQADGSHACTCPDAAELTPTAETDCNLALLHACQAPCETSAGSCEPKENGFDCTCGAGFQRTAESGLCDYALFWSCEPACSNEAGACYHDPTGVDPLVCRCNGDAAASPVAPVPDGSPQDECKGPLAATCGGSAEGPNVWP